MTQQPPLQPTPVGAFRFNSDSSNLEYYDGNQWVNVLSDSTITETGGTRGLFGGGYQAPAKRDFIEYVSIDSAGTSVDFGNLIAANKDPSGLSSRTRGVFGGGDTGSAVDTIQTVNVATTGNAVDVGDLTAARDYAAPMNSPTRGVFAGGSGTVNTLII